MKKKNLKELSLKKETISKLSVESRSRIIGGSGNPDCPFYQSFDVDCEWSKGFDDLKNVSHTSDNCYQ